jgi:L-alanine-DL-glutamate epimerase-like enolase superfamily enzyme
MIVTDVTVTLFLWRVKQWPVGTMAFGGDVPLGIVTIHTDDGIEGHSFLGAARPGNDMTAKRLVEALKPVVVNRNPLDIGTIWADMYRKKRWVSLSAIGAIDVALWDLAGKVAGLPIHRMLGSCRSSVPAYASSAWFATPKEYAEEALRFHSMGWTAYKIHPHGDPVKDVEICRTVREAVGSSMVLMLDAMWAYGYEEALRVGRAIEKLDYFWYEDPLEEEDVYGYVKLRNKLDIPIISTEFIPGGLYGMPVWVMEKATDMLRGDVAVTGGITPLIRAAHLADAFRMKFEIHHGGNSLNNVANLHVTMAIDNCDYYEVFPSSGANKYGLVEDIEVDKEGLVHAPEKPGLGFEIDWELVRRDKIQVIS